MSSYKSYEGSYHDVSVHKMMLQDVVRTEAYERALRKVVSPGCRVMDFGCGTGVMSIFASRFGAKKVIAVDRSVFIKKAREIAACNKIENISFLHGDHLELEVDEKVDVIVSEWMGHFLFYEAMLGPLIKIRDRFLASGGVMVPSTATLYAGLVIDEYMYEDLAFLEEKPYDIDFSPIADVPLRQISLQNFLPNQLLDTTINLGTLDLATIDTPPRELLGEMDIKKDVTIYGVRGWFSVSLVEGITLGTGPNDAPTHWSQIYFPLPEPLEVAAGATLKISITPPSDTEETSFWRWSVSDGEKTMEMNDLEHRKDMDIKLPFGPVETD